jgi:hypothetical protein
LTFVIDTQGLRLIGACDASAPGALLVSIDGLLWQQPLEPVLGVAQLVRTLVPRNDVLVPATAASDWLMRHLPLPDARPPRDPGSARVPQVHMHGASTIQR